MSPSFDSPYLCPGYRLPTEAEWEYAARAGSTEGTYAGELDDGHLQCETPNEILDPIAWYCGNENATTHVGAELAPNDFGLYDVLGNVFEWCHDWYGDYPTGQTVDQRGLSEGTERVVRGGSYSYFARYARSAARLSFSPGSKYDFVGFRPVRTIVAP